MEALGAPPNAITVNYGYMAAWWAAIRDRCDKSMRLVLKKAGEAGLYVPPFPVDLSINLIPTYHIKGIRNIRCKRARYYCTHTAEQGDALLHWATA